jgi:hypothetical protein
MIGNCMNARVLMLVHRILRKLEMYRSLAEEDMSIPDASILPGDTIIGVYLNPGLDRKVLIGSHAIYYQENTWVVVKYSDIRTVNIEDSETKHTANTLIFFLSDGSIQRMHVDGGDAKFRDIYEFLRFFRRVINP